MDILEAVLRTAGKQRENVIWSAQAGCERTAGQCHSPDSPPPCWQMEFFLRSETGTCRSFLMTVFCEPFVLSLIHNKLVCKDKEISHWVSQKYPFETHWFISSQCCLIVPALSWGSGQAQQDNCAPVVGMLLTKCRVVTEGSVALPTVRNLPFFSFLFCRATSPAYCNIISFPEAAPQSRTMG